MNLSWDSSRRTKTKNSIKVLLAVKNLWDSDKNKQHNLRKNNTIEENISHSVQLAETDCWLLANFWKTKEWKMKLLMRSWPTISEACAKVSISLISELATVSIIQRKRYIFLDLGKIQTSCITQLRRRIDVLLLQVCHQSSPTKF